MNPEAIHLMLNHVPVIGSLLATGVLAFGLIRRQEDILRLSLYLFVFAAVMALPVYFSGEGAEEAVEHLPGVAEALIESHEDLATIAIFVIEALGLVSIGALILSFRQTRLPLWAAAGVGLLALVNSGVLAQTAHLGGQIRHPEIRQGATQSTGQNETGSAHDANRSEPKQSSTEAPESAPDPALDPAQGSQDAERNASEHNDAEHNASERNHLETEKTQAVENHD